MIVGIGLDLIDIRELQDEIDERREQWLKRVFTAGEPHFWTRQPDPYRHLAAALVAQEPTHKAFGNGWTDRTDWLDIEITHDRGKPNLVLKGSVMRIHKKLHISKQFVSITHTQIHAAAVVVLEA